MLEDIVVVGTLIVLEGLLSADNALVLAVLVGRLPKHQQQKALLYGIAGAFVFRFAALATVKFLLQSWYLRAAGGGYLAYLAVAHFVRKHKASHKAGGVEGNVGFWRTVFVVEMTDIAFAVDSILAAVGLSNKLWVVYTGGILGVITMRFVAGFFIRLLEKLPKLEASAYLLIGWIAVKLLLEAYEVGFLVHEGASAPEHLLPHWLFWTVLFAISAGGVLFSYRAKDERGDVRGP